MSVGTAKLHDPRVRLIREKYFSIRPKPLERWLWSQNIPASAERVFWLHWQEGQQRGDWCSEIPLRRVAHECNLDVSTVTRAYQCLTRLACIRRTDPGRDPANPFHQATAITEVRIPAELLQGLHRYPNRKQPTELNPAVEQRRAHGSPHSEANESEHSAAKIEAFLSPQTPSQTEDAPNAAPEKRSLPNLRKAAQPAPAPNSEEPSSPALSDKAPASAPNNPAPPTATAAYETSTTSSAALQPSSPLAALTGRDRAKALAEITALLSPTERDSYHQALRLHRPIMSFDPDSKVSAEKRAFLVQALTTLAADGTAPATPKHPSAHPAPTAPQRKLSLFHIARLKRDIQSATSTTAAPELLRQVVWSIEAGALRRFSPLHALNIALKKIREGSWTRPHRMPPNWAPAYRTPTLRTSSPHETCNAA